MRRVSMLAAIAMVLLAAAGAAAAEAWRTFSSPELGFSIELPGEPQASSREITAASGVHATMHGYGVDLGSQGAVVVAIVDAPADASPPPDAQAALEGGVQNMVRQQQLVMVSDVETTVSGAPARDVVARSDTAHYELRGRVVARGRRLFQVLVITPDGSTFSGSDRVFDSFRLLPPSP